MVGRQSLAERCEHVASGVPLCRVALIKLDPEGGFNFVDGDDLVTVPAKSNAGRQCAHEQIIMPSTVAAMAVIHPFLAVMVERDLG